MTSSKNALPLPHPPFFDIPNVNNLRDCATVSGGLPTSDGKKIRKGILFRSADVSNLDRDGWREVKRIGVKKVFDLRSKSEVEKGWKGITGENVDAGEEGKDVRLGWLEDMEAEGVERTWVPVFEATDYSPERLAERYSKYMDESTQGFVEAYRDILEHAASAYGSILRYLASLPPPKSGETQEQLGALIHCTAGKDRTGIFFGVILQFLGVEKAKIAEEYHLTELGLSHIRDEVAGRLMLSSAFTSYINSQVQGRTFSSEEVAHTLKKSREGDDVGKDDIPLEVVQKARQAALRMIGAKRKSMLGALDMVDDVWGSAEGYLRNVVGLRDNELEDLKRNLLVDI